nr:hypothetical protein [Tanacetum cinerariifolium]
YRASNLKCIKTLDKELEELKLEKDGLDGKLADLLKASKNLDNLIESQRSDKVKEGVGYNVVPPPAAADLYLSPKKDLSWTGLPEFADNTVTDYSRPALTVESTSEEGQNKNSSTSEGVASPITPKPFVKFVKPKDYQSERSQNNAYMRPPHRPVGHRPHGAPMRPPYRPDGHKPHGPPMKPMRPNMNVRPQYRAPWVPTVNRNFPPVNRKLPTGNLNVSTVCCCCSRHVNTARPKVVINRRNRVKDVQAENVSIRSINFSGVNFVLKKKYCFRPRSTTQKFNK